VEIVQREKFNRAFSRRFKGDLYETIHDVFSLLNDMDDRINLASSIYISSRSNDLKKLFEERIAMEACVSETPGKEQIKYFKFLKITGSVKEYPVYFDEIRDDPVLIGGMLAIKARFVESNEFTKRGEFYAKDHKRLSIE
jgi:hypothetical protein